MKNLAVAGKNIKLNDDGFLIDERDWSPEVAQKLATSVGIESLDDEKMEIVIFLRNYYKKFHAFPILNYVCKHVKQPSQCLNNEFINPMNAWKIAGLPKLDGIHFVAVDGKNFKLEECC
ncbi:TusE/DsrC/DsvC family sulfur relay protein [Desulforhopalus singaporensis]|uniref:tRNA 2-thiouridine synthesizing protein E n=1 Tax=Desulforhopalus singaporensis TaxID=91360 RepID=A0A1H0IXI6_9BACT|nr:TusE/DsrC/DsvC family sulfur relay protein [Desulforhopalus singaporensis]SDO35781.1 tRNA 2-thiouridine synthesizing protein E [Desulforhopalus singaporensis]